MRRLDRQVAQPAPELPAKPGRTFSKRLVVASVTLAWLALFYAIFAGQPTVAIAGFSFIATVAAGYMGVGHLDLRQLLNALRQSEYGVYPPSPPPVELRDG